MSERWPRGGRRGKGSPRELDALQKPDQRDIIIASLRAALDERGRLLDEAWVYIYNRLSTEDRVHRGRDLATWNLLNRIDEHRPPAAAEPGEREPG